MHAYLIRCDKRAPTFGVPPGPRAAAVRLRRTPSAHLRRILQHPLVTRSFIHGVVAVEGGVA